MPLSEKGIMTLSHLSFTPTLTIRNQKRDRADFGALKIQLVEIGWKEEYLRSGQNKTVEELWRTLKSNLVDLRNRFVPKTKASNIPKWRERGYVPVSKSLQEAIRNKKITHRRWMSAKTRSDAEDTHKVYAKTRNKVKTLMRKAKRNFEKDAAQKSKNNPKAFWSYVRSKLKTKADVGPLLANVKDKTSSKFTDVEKANILQYQFSSVFTHGPEGELPSFSTRTSESIFDILITEDMVYNEIIKLSLIVIEQIVRP